MNENNHFMLWHCMKYPEAAANLKCDISAGLHDSEVPVRRKLYGENRITASKKASPVLLFFDQFKNTLIIILIIATILSGILGHVVEAVAIGVIIMFAVLLGFIQEFRAERALEALRDMAAPLATVLRGGIEKRIQASELVPGDIILLASGDRVPADARLVEAVNLQADEAVLTGESLPVPKERDYVATQDATPGERRNMVFSGTTVTYGRGRGIVTSTGMGTEFGRIAEMLQHAGKVITPLQKNLDRVGRILAKAAFLLVAVVVILGVARDHPLLDMIVFGIALAVAVVPEALPAVVTISLAIGVQRMVKRHALVRYLPAVETLGCTSMICSDKTGTLTKNEMTVRRLLTGNGRIVDVTGSGYDPAGDFTGNGQVVEPDDGILVLLKAAALCSDAHFTLNGDKRELNGDPTEGAIVTAAEKAGMDPASLRAEYERIDEIPFTTESRRMTTLHNHAGGRIAFAKGAAEEILGASTSVFANGMVNDLTPETRERIMGNVAAFGTDALRVIAAAYRETGSVSDTGTGLVFLGLIGMIDPPRPEARAAIDKCRSAGIGIMMITGDHPATAGAIAGELGLLGGGRRVVTGNDIASMDDLTLRDSIKGISVCARVSPEHKLRIVQSLQSIDEVVAMTGDGINDAPALKKADIGVAMGITGTDVSKEAADMTLTDDNFASIVAAVEEGRIIFSNIKKYLMYLLSSNLGEIGLMLTTSMMGLPLPLSAVQILYVNLATDGLPALALAVDPPDPGIMKRHPRKINKGIFSRPVILLIVAGGLWSTLVNTSLYFWAMHTGRSTSEIMTIVFASLVLIQFFKAYNFRSDRNSVFKKPFQNRWLNTAITWEVTLILFVIYLPVLQNAFGTFSMTAADWGVVFGVSVTIIPFIEICKFFLRRRYRE
ncbi:MAG TPA: cation-translocating P-type ATPase [Spirochaetota bacterium]|nr:cation-translocating P-type ATPase [Spirochaetota bacterium]